MKFLKVVSSLVLAISLSAQAQTSGDAEFLEPKQFQMFTFTGCVITIDRPSSYIYAHIASTTLSTSINTVSVQINGTSYSEKFNKKDEFVKEYIHRQNYCSFIRK